jgi:hypothetical protein
MTSLSERTQSVPERTQNLAERSPSLPERTHAPGERSQGLNARLPERPRDLKEVALVLIDGTEIRGVLHRTQGTRTLDYLNRQAEAFVAMTDAMLFHRERTEHVSFIAINKAHIIRVIEAEDAD